MTDTPERIKPVVELLALSNEASRDNTVLALLSQKTQNLAAQYLIGPHSELRKGSRSGQDIGSADHDKQVSNSQKRQLS